MGLRKLFATHQLPNSVRRRPSSWLLAAYEAPDCLHQKAITKRLSKKFSAVTKGGRQISAAIAGYEEEGNASLMKNSGNLINTLTPEVDIEHRGIARCAASETYGS